MNIGAGIRLAGMGAAPKGVIPGQSEHVAFMRAWKAHPPGFTAGEIAGQLAAVARYGNTLAGKLPVQVFADFDKKPLYRAIAKLEELHRIWSGRMGWFPWAPSAKHYGKTDPQVQAVYTAIVKVHQEAQGAKGGGDVVKEARKELRDNLLKPERWAWWQKLRPWVIGGGIVAGLAVGYPYVRPLLRRVSP